MPIKQRVSWSTIILFLFNAGDDMLFGVMVFNATFNNISVISWQRKSGLVNYYVHLQTFYEIYTSCNILVVAPFSADSANSHQGCFSRVQKANGIAVRKVNNISKFVPYLYDNQFLEFTNISI